MKIAFLSVSEAFVSCFLDYQPDSVFSSMMSLPPSHVNSLDRIMPVHPDVRLKPLPFYDTIAEILKPSTLSKSINIVIQLRGNRLVLLR